MFSARLRLPGDLPHEQKVRKVDEIIDILGLHKCADTIVGDDEVSISPICHRHICLLDNQSIDWIIPQS